MFTWSTVLPIDVACHEWRVTVLDNTWCQRQLTWHLLSEKYCHCQQVCIVANWHICCAALRECTIDLISPETWSHPQNVSHMASQYIQDGVSGHTVMFSDLLSIFQKKFDGHHPCARLHLHAKFQLRVFCSFQAVTWKKNTSESNHPLAHLTGRLPQLLMKR